MENRKPTPQQCYACFILCRMLTAYYRPIALVTYDERIERIYILAGEDLQVLIYPDSTWRLIR